ncbi:serine hydrolase domain-containing protein [Leptospira sp. GIMC2001]|uniref:serine hydrolase domain-containing protein n=1 Tax=Leptospira sp. GIMC2001 TaxID=1513297 RepID=UPI00234A1526|nr:serine hydrolase [Leptospira sp. GIMC2001]WCL49140.1 serine hydrolase [Leptospira sp. GIMC2001]
MLRFFLSVLFVTIILLSSNCGKPSIELKPYGDPIVLEDLKPPRRDYWPTQAWRVSKPEAQGMNSSKLLEMEKYAFTIEGTPEDRQGTRTDGVVIIRNGYLVYENYGRGYSAEQKHLIWSIAKSYTNALVGVAVSKGLVQLDDPAYKYVPELGHSEEHKKITIRHILNMSSGLEASEGYESSPLVSTVIAMLYTKGRANMGAYSASLGLRAEPGSFVYYSSCDTNILSLALQNIYGKEVYSDLPWKDIFNPLGIKNVTYERDGNDVFVGSSYIYTTPRDMAKFGYLYLNDGIWENKRILPQGWVTLSRTPSPAYKSTPYYTKLEEDNYTAQWYANTGVPEAGIPKPMPDAPADTFYGSGHWGQRLFVIPSLDLVIVRVGDDRNVKFFDNNLFIKYIVESIQ